MEESFDFSREAAHAWYTLPYRRMPGHEGRTVMPPLSSSRICPPASRFKLEAMTRLHQHKSPHLKHPSSSLSCCSSSSSSSDTFSLSPSSSSPSISSSSCPSLSSSLPPSSSPSLSSSSSFSIASSLSPSSSSFSPSLSSSSSFSISSSLSPSSSSSSSSSSLSSSSSYSSSLSPSSSSSSSSSLYSSSLLPSSSSKAIASNKQWILLVAPLSKPTQSMASQHISSSPTLDSDLGNQKEDTKEKKEEEEEDLKKTERPWKKRGLKMKLIHFLHKLGLSYPKSSDDSRRRRGRGDCDFEIRGRPHVYYQSGYFLRSGSAEDRLPFAPPEAMSTLQMLF